MENEQLESIVYLDWYFGEDDGGADKDAVKAYEKLREAIFRLSAEQRWIPVSEDKPHSMTNKVLVFCQGEDAPDYVGFAHYEKYNGEEIWYNLETGEPFETWGLTVTHWKETPEKPKKDE